MKYVNVSAKLSIFYKEAILHWQESNSFVPTAKKDVRDQIAWNYLFIKISKASAYFRRWLQAGICKLSSPFDVSVIQRVLTKIQYKMQSFYSIMAFFQQLRESGKISKTGRTSRHS